MHPPDDALRRSLRSGNMSAHARHETHQEMWVARHTNAREKSISAASHVLRYHRGGDWGSRRLTRQQVGMPCLGDGNQPDGKSRENLRACDCRFCRSVFKTATEMCHRGRGTRRRAAGITLGECGIRGTLHCRRHLPRASGSETEQSVGCRRGRGRNNPKAKCPRLALGRSLQSACRELIRALPIPCGHVLGYLPGLLATEEALPGAVQLSVPGGHFGRRRETMEPHMRCYAEDSQGPSRWRTQARHGARR